MFAALILEREPLRFEQTPEMLEAWVQTAGGFAALALVIWLLARLAPGARGGPGYPPIVATLAKILIPLALLGELAYLALKAPEWITVATASLQGSPVVLTVREGMRTAQRIALTGGGAAALLAVCLPLLADLFSGRVKPRRIGAMARLSFKEAVRRRVLWAFLAVVGLYLFYNWFNEANKPEDQVRDYVQTVAFVTAVFVLTAAGLGASFGIPTDVKQQTIHTVVTKPVERFEIVLGRFIGYTLLMTCVLVVLTVLNLGFLFRSVTQEAREESLKAREPILGRLEFEDEKEGRIVRVREHGISVGREWDYRSYITGPTQAPEREYAVWTFDGLPADLAGRKDVHCEFTFDVYRTSKGREENRGVFCTFYFETGTFERQNEQAYNQEMLRARDSATADQDQSDKLAEKYGFYQAPAVEVVDYHTLSLKLPGGLFRNAANVPAGKPPLRIRVRCDSRTQYVGMAKADLYLRHDDPGTTSDTFRFAANYFKASSGLWMRLCVVIGLAVAFSTYLSGIVSALLTFFLFVCGLFQDYISSLASGQSPGGGPMESLIRLVKRQQSLMTPLEETGITKAAFGTDFGFRWFLSRVLDIIPDADRFDMTGKLAEGFNVSGGELAVAGLLLVGYLIPLGILSYHLLRSREIAAPT